jgi:hypothetical protein
MTQQSNSSALGKTMTAYSTARQYGAGWMLAVFVALVIATQRHWFEEF